MAPIRALVVRHAVAAYFLLTFTISWAGFLLATGVSSGMQGTTPASDPRFANALIAMLAGPSVGGLVMTAVMHGRAGLRRLAARVTAWRVGPGWYAMALLPAPALMLGTLVALSAVSPAFLPGLVAADDRTSLVITSLVVGLSAGFVEEIGWTGFATPALTRHGRVLAAGLGAGIGWSAWHLPPNLWASQAAAGDLSLAAYLATTGAGVFVGYLTAFRILMVWVYERTGSVFVLMLMHASFTSSLLILNPVGIDGAELAIYSFVLAAAVWALVGILAWRTSGFSAGARAEGWWAAEESNLRPSG